MLSPLSGLISWLAALLLALLFLPSCNRTSTPATPPGTKRPALVADASVAGPVAMAMPAEPELVTFASGSLTLHGFLWRPVGDGPFPAVVFNHGSEALPGTKEGQARFYVPHGFVLFVPHRRGQGQSKDAGRYINELYDPTAPDSPAFIDELVAQNDDVIGAVEYVARLPYVDPKRIAVSGCSLGGIESLLAAERAPRIVAAVDFAGAAMTWATNRPLRERMKIAARSARVPVLFLQAENDYDTTPSRVLSEEMMAAGKRGRAHVYPPNGAGHQEGHAFCGGGESPPWGAEVLAFLGEAMKPR